MCFGQCLTAVGWVGGTLPELYEEDGMVEVTTADVANGGFVVGALKRYSSYICSQIPRFSVVQRSNYY